MLESQFAWQTVEPVDTDRAQKLQIKFKLAPAVANILVNRGYSEDDAVEQFLHPQLADIHPPEKLHDLDKAVNRIMQAIEAGEQITIYGDYDADGITSTAVMYETLMTLGAEVNYYVPNRFTDGYGPNVDAFQRLIDAGTQLIVTVDNGVTGNEAIGMANDQGVDVVVTDHHELPDQLPDAVAIVHPRYPGTDYPFGELSGVGVAFKVAWALLEEFPAELLDLVAIGEVADLVSVKEENRALITFGIQQLRQGLRPGIHDLVNLASINEQTLNETNIAFALAPRLNALGRMEDANAGVELLTTLDEGRAQALADEVQQLNSQRQKIVAEITTAAENLATDPDHRDQQTLIITGDGWHEGVLGIVASRIVEQTGKPTLILNRDSETGLAKGSGRSVEGYDLFKTIDRVRELTTAFGGHQMAVGITVPVANLERLSEAMETAASEAGLSEQPKHALKIAVSLTADEINLDLYNQVEMLAPFGPDNPRPLFEVEDAQLANAKSMGKTNAHLKFELVGDQSKVNAIAFNRGALVEQLAAAKTGISVVGSLDENEWRGNKSIQLMVKDLQIRGVQIIDQRTNHLADELFTHSGYYLFFNHRIADRLADHVDSAAVLFADAPEVPVEISAITIVDFPASVADLLQVLQRFDQLSTIRLYFYEQQSVYLNGMPTREEFGHLYKFIQTHSNVDVNHNIKLLSDFLKINQEKLIFMIKVFFEAGFVKIDGGVLNRVPNPETVALEATDRYRQRQTLMETERELIYSDSVDLTNLLLQSIGSDREEIN